MVDGAGPRRVEAAGVEGLGSSAELVGVSRSVLRESVIGVAELGREAAALEVGEGGLVRRDHAGAAPGLDAHVADGHAAFHREGADGGAGKFDDITGRACRPDLADDVEDDVLGGDAVREGSLDIDAEGLGLVLRQRLGGHDVLDLAGADAEGQGAERSVGAGVRVAADDGHAGLGGAEFGADHVDDSLLRGLDVEELYTKLGAVLAQGFDLAGGDLVEDVQAVFDRRGGDVVVDGGDGAVGAAELATGEAEAVEGLGAGDLVDEVEIDVEDRLGSLAGAATRCWVPDFFEQRCAELW